MQSVDIVVTGGTFDKTYDELKGRLFFRRTHVPEMLALGRCRLKLNVRSLMMIDSLDMKPADRLRVLEACRKSRSRRVVVTHGTDTMVETAKVLGSAKLDKTIILTGAMIPYKFGSSDGLFNLGAALAFAQTLPAGVYVSMNGRCFPFDRVRKDRARGIFVSA